MTKIYSMCSNECVYPNYKKSEGGECAPNAIKNVIIIKGGANVADSESSRGNKTPKFVETEVTSAELESLKANDAFMRKVDRGFITIGKPPATLKADKSAQTTEKQMKAKAPKASATTGQADDK